MNTDPIVIVGLARTPEVAGRMLVLYQEITSKALENEKARKGS